MVNVSKNFNKFCDFGFNKAILCILKSMNYITPTSVQKKCIPFILNNYNILGVAKTGSGKTAAYILPILNKIIIDIDVIQCLVLAPTRELVIQIINFLNIFAKKFNIKTLALYGGQKYYPQLISLKKGVHIIVATPGRLLDHLKSKNLNLSRLKVLVLDEADEMLNMGFLEDVKSIMLQVNQDCQKILFSATMPLSIKKVVYKFIHSAKEIYISKDKYHVPQGIMQYYCFMFSYKEKLIALMKFIETEVYSVVIIFVRTKSYTTELCSYIISKGYTCLFLNGDMNQNLREKTIQRLRTNNNPLILVATDIASRGLDLKNVDLVINYDIPMDINSYIHRVGRTGRAGKIGKTILFVTINSRKESRFLYMLKKVIKNINKITIPSKQIIDKKRIYKISKLISEINLVNSSKYSFYKNLLQKIIKHSNLEINQITLSLLVLFYNKIFPYY